ncbi:MAG: DUF2927 domain-containing protein [Rhodoplanes sp.]|uniref:DUF2927 domain-containing protein n=1 Tax=Rhodoplanes sp. TaxID=1968906 RepID=UPI0017D4FE49|nr:DUF2927 domain-containing protein [Rhodoplanes sp.]NVO16142.1 DUF2927 domain-containing protein [Rhodoplanes sp.]
MRTAFAAGLAAVLALLAPAIPLQARDKTARPASAEPTRFTDRQILRGFLAVAIGAEYASTPGDRIRRFEGPVRVFIDAAPDLGDSAARTAMVETVVATIGSHVAHLDIAVTPDRGATNLTVMLVKDRDLGRTITAVFGRERGGKILRRLQPQCVSGFSRDAAYRIEQAVAVLAADISDFDFRDCAYEEILQALGPINDTAAVPWTMFNDAVRTGRFGRYDQYILGLLYHPHLAPGMTRDEARTAARAALPEVRERVDRVAADDKGSAGRD